MKENTYCKFRDSQYIWKYSLLMFILILHKFEDKLYAEI